MAVQPEFSACADGSVEVRLGPAWAAFQDALADAVGTRAPARSKDRNPSPYWIDRALAVVHAPPAHRAVSVVAAGNAGQLLRRGDLVVARSLYDMWDDQAMPVHDFVRVLTTWRNQVLPSYTAPDGSYEIEPRWKEEVVYWEGDRGYRFDAGWGVEPGVLYVPSRAVWDDVVPPWLRGRHSEVVGRLTEHSRHRVEPTDDGYSRGGAREADR